MNLEIVALGWWCGMPGVKEVETVQLPGFHVYLHDDIVGDLIMALSTRNVLSVSDDASIPYLSFLRQTSSRSGVINRIREDEEIPLYI